MPRTFTIFLSYQHYSSLSVAEQLWPELKAALTTDKHVEYRLLRDVEQINAGQRFEDFMQEAKQANLVLALWTQKYFTSPPCIYEAWLAAQDNHSIEGYRVILVEPIDEVLGPDGAEAAQQAWEDVLSKANALGETYLNQDTSTFAIPVPEIEQNISSMKGFLEPLMHRRSGEMLFTYTQYYARAWQPILETIREAQAKDGWPEAERLNVEEAVERVKAYRSTHLPPSQRGWLNYRWQSRKGRTGQHPVCKHLPEDAVAINPFLGREAPFAEVVNALLMPFGRQAKTNSNHVVALTGLGGMGKTRLAQEIVRRAGHLFPGGVAWVRIGDEGLAEPPMEATFTPANIEQFWREAARQWGREPDDKITGDELRQALSNGLDHADGPSLVVWDNLEEGEHRTVFPSGLRLESKNLVGLVTTRATKPHGVDQVIPPLQALDETSALRLITGMHEATNAELDVFRGIELFKELAEEVGRYPLALSILAVETRGQADVAEEVLDELRAPTDGVARLEAIAATISGLPTEHTASIVATFERSWANSTDSQRRILTHLAVLASSPFPIELLQAALQLEADAPLRGFASDLRTLHQDRGLLQRTTFPMPEGVQEDPPEGAFLHPILRQVLYHLAERDLPDSTTQARARLMGLLLNKLNPTGGWDSPASQPATHRHWSQLGPHLEALEPGSEHVLSSLTWFGLSILTETLGLWSQALVGVERSIDFLIKHFNSANHPSVALARIKRGTLLRNYGRYQEALNEFEVVKNITLEDHPIILAHGRIYRASVLVKLGPYDDAIKDFNDGIDILTKHYGSANHPEVALARMNLASFHQTNGSYEVALEEYDAIIEILNNHYNSDVHSNEHPEVTRTRINRAIVLHQLGHHEEALLEYNACIVNLTKLYGTANHPQVAIARMNRAGVYRLLGKYEEALDEVEDVIAIKSKQYGSKNHPQVIFIRINRASILLDLMRYDEALEEYNAVVDIRTKHPESANLQDIATERMNHANILQHFDRYEEALVVYEAVVDIRRKHYGADNVETATAEWNLALLFDAMGRDAEAKAIQDRVRPILEDYNRL